jgi:hypothetical protein
MIPPARPGVTNDSIDRCRPELSRPEKAGRAVRGAGNGEIAVISSYARSPGSVPPATGFLSPHRIATAIGAARTAIGVVFLAVPVTSLRLLGVDTETAKRMSFLATMAAGRDLALGAGTTAAARHGRVPVGWLAAGAAADITDVVAISAALRHGRVAGLPAVAALAGAVAAAGAAGWAVTGCRKK